MKKNNEETKKIESEIVENTEEKANYFTENNLNNELETPKKTEYKIKTKSNTKKIIILCVILFLIIAVLSTGFAVLNISNNNIIAGVKIRDIDVSGLSKDQATEKLSTLLEEESNKEVKLNIENEEYTILPTQIEVSYDIENAVKEATMYGNNNNIFVNNYNIILSMIKGININLNVTYNEELLNQCIKDINAKIPDAIIESSYYIDKDAKELVIKSGTIGSSINIEETKNKVIDTIKLGNFNQIIIETNQGEPKPIDIETIYNEVHCEPQDAYYTTNPFQIYEEVDGIDFNVDECKEILKEKKEEYVVALTITKASKTISQIGTEAFPDLLGTCTTHYDASNKPRSTNLEVATKKLNGTVVKSGETFSYNKTLGERTYAAGYREAHGYAGGKVVDMLGGGICQISSTLYDAVVFSNLEIVERYNHMFLATYLGVGKDATVSYGTLDFKFKNTRNYPVMIKALAQNGVAKIDIYGIKEENEYEIDMESTVLNYVPYSVIYQDDSSMVAGTTKTVQGGLNGCKSMTYKVYKLNGLEVKREVISTDTYSPLNKIVKRGVTNAVESTTTEEPTQNTTTNEENQAEPTNMVVNTTHTNTNNVVNANTNTTTNNTVTNTIN